MASRWHTAKRCRIALASLLTDITTKKRTGSQLAKPHHDSSVEDIESSSNAPSSGAGSHPSPKKRKINGTSEIEPEREVSSHLRHPSLPLNSGQQYHISPTSVPGPLSDASSGAIEGTPGRMDGLNFPDMSRQPGPSFVTQGQPEPVRADFPTPGYQVPPQGLMARDSVSGWSHMMSGNTNAGLPGQYVDDQYLGGFDFNMSDVFEGATWENLMAFMNQDGG